MKLSLKSLNRRNDLVGLGAKQIRYLADASVLFPVIVKRFSADLQSYAHSRFIIHHRNRLDNSDLARQSNMRSAAGAKVNALYACEPDLTLYLFFASV